jgi:hypothetical protein
MDLFTKMYEDSSDFLVSRIVKDQINFGKQVLNNRNISSKQKVFIFNELITLFNLDKDIALDHLKHENDDTKV